MASGTKAEKPLTEEEAFIEKDIVGYLEQHQRKELLRFTTVGSVDDGKSTLIGRLLYDAHGLYEDQLRAVERASSTKSDMLDLSLVTDGLKAEREQGITIDVAYRYFSTERRKFIIADTPGHVQYTRNMATGASTADVAVILIDARLGVLQQSRRHAYIASLLGIPHLAVCVNKMDLRGYEQGVYEAIKATFAEFSSRLGFKDVTYVPISALKGDNIVHGSTNTPWYSGPTLLSHLETVPIAHDRNLRDFRYAVQYVLRPNLDYRAFAGEVASGIVKKGDAVVVLPSRKTTRIKAIDTYEGEVEKAFAPMSVALRLEDEVDVSRGDMLVHADNLPAMGQRFEAMVVWMSERPLDVAKSYLLKHTTQMVRAEVTAVLGHTDLENLEERPGAGLSLNDIGRVRVETHRALFFDPYAKNRRTGAFILVDSLTNNTVAAGMIIGTGAAVAAPSGDRRLRTQVSPAERRERLGQSGAVVVLAGSAPPAELTELAFAVERALFDARRVAMVVTAAGSSAPVVARELARAGLVAIVTGLELHAQAGKDEEPVLKVRVFGEGEAAGAGEQGVLSVSLAGAGMETAAARIVAELP
jgi:bifunctional enzyme CysN/CysC/sulfate adenylyltransferase subunit 1